VSEPESSSGSRAFGLIGLLGTTEGVEAPVYRPLAPEELTSSRDPSSSLMPGASSSIVPGAGPTTSPSGQAVLYEADMLSLEELLNRHRVAYTIFERDVSRNPSLPERRAWMFLLALSFTWGLLTAWALMSEGFLIQPATALFGCLAIIVLVVTLVVESRPNRRG